MATMTAMVLNAPGRPLEKVERPVPEPGPGQVQIRVAACGVCRTDLHVVDGELPFASSLIVPGHEIVGRVTALGRGVTGFRLGARVGVPWLGHSCGTCPYCASQRENLCDAPGFTGATIDGGYADYCVADARHVLPLPDAYDDLHAAPLLCAGLIGYRSFSFVPEAKALGLYGFGAAAHIVVQIARHAGMRVHAFTRAGDEPAQDFALKLGAVSASGSDEPPPEPLDAAIIFAPVGALVPAALKAVRKGGTVVCAGIHMSDIPSFPYAILWEERVVRSVANLTRKDGEDFLTLAPLVPVETHVVPYPLAEANAALADLRAGRLSGAAVLVP